jgi:predicted xylose isomerase-like sugar epimerase
MSKEKTPSYWDKRLGTHEGKTLPLSPRRAYLNTVMPEGPQTNDWIVRRIESRRELLQLAHELQACGKHIHEALRKATDASLDAAAQVEAYKDALEDVLKKSGFGDTKNLRKIFDMKALNGWEPAAFLTPTPKDWTQLMLGQLRKKKLARIGLKSNKDVMQRIVADPEALAAYKGLRGYIHFAKYYAGGNMQNAFMTLSALLKEQGIENISEALGWGGQMLCTVAEATALLNEVSSPEKLATFKTTYTGFSGYVTFAQRKEFGGSMLSAFKTLSALLKEQGIQNISETMDWGGQMRCTAAEAAALFNEVSTPEKLAAFKTKYSGFTGYVTFAQRKEFGGSMLSAFKTLSALLKEQGIQNISEALGWGGVMTYTATEAQVLLNEVNTSEQLAAFKAKYSGFSGYITFAQRKEFSGNMQSAFMTLSALLKEQGIQNISETMDWGGQIQCSAAEAQVLLNEVNTSEHFTKFKTAYCGFSGYMKFAQRKEFGGNMQSTFQTLSALLKEQGIQNISEALDWGGQIQCTAAEALAKYEAGWTLEKIRKWAKSEKR